MTRSVLMHHYRERSGLEFVEFNGDGPGVPLVKVVG